MLAPVNACQRGDFDDVSNSGNGRNRHSTEEGLNWDNKSSKRAKIGRIKIKGLKLNNKQSRGAKIDIFSTK